MPQANDVAGVREELQEKGLPTQAPPPADGALPPGKSQWSVPFFQQFASVMNLFSRTHYPYYDNAIADSILNARIMRDDPIVDTAICNRARPVSMLESHLEPDDETNQRLVDEAQEDQKILDDIPQLQALKFWLMQDLFWGRAGLQLTAGYDYKHGKKRTIIKRWSPVNSDSIVFRYDDETPGIMVNSSIYDGEWEATTRGPAHFLRDPTELELFIWSEFEPEAVDYYDSLKTGLVHGRGYRHRLYWFWWLRERLLQILMDFLQKVGTGILIYYYEAGNPKSLEEVTTAASTQSDNHVYLFPRARDGTSAYSGPGIQYIPIGMEGANIFQEWFEIINNIIKSAIMGEVGTTEEMSTGIGGSGPDQHSTTADQRVKYDANRLEFACQKIVNAISRWNHPGSIPPKFKFMVEKRNPEEFANSLQIAYDLGLDISENQVRDVFGLPKPKPGEPVLSKIQAMQPAAVGATPSGVPMSAPGGPAVSVNGAANGQPNGSPAGQDPNAPQQAQSIGAQSPVVQGTPVQQSRGDPVRLARDFHDLNEMVERFSNRSRKDMEEIVKDRSIDPIIEKLIARVDELEADLRNNDNAASHEERSEQMTKTVEQTIHAVLDANAKKSKEEAPDITESVREAIRSELEPLIKAQVDNKSDEIITKKIEELTPKIIDAMRAEMPESPEPLLENMRAQITDAIKASMSEPKEPIEQMIDRRLKELMPQGQRADDPMVAVAAKIEALAEAVKNQPAPIIQMPRAASDSHKKTMTYDEEGRVATIVQIPIEDET